MRFLFGGAQPQMCRAVDSWAGLERFLLTGTSDGTYRAADPEVDRAECIAECLEDDGRRVVERVVSFCQAGRAPRGDAPVLVLAMAASPKYAGAAVNDLALAALPLVARTSAELASFVAYAREFRGWGRSLRNAVARWYTEKPARELATQMLKCRHRARWSHRDLIRMAHPKTGSEAHNALIRWAVGDELDVRTDPSLLAGDLRQVHGYEQLRDTTDERRAANLVEEYKLTHEMIGPEWKRSALVWEALLPSLSYGALLKHLGTLTTMGLLEMGREAGALVVARLLDRSRIRRSKVHPLAVFHALEAYRRGADWTPSPGILHALETAFYAALENVQVIERRVYVALDASQPVAQSARPAAALALVLSRSEPHMAAFDDGAVWTLDVDGRERLSDIAGRLPCVRGASDGSLPVLDALARRMEIDAFVIVTGEDRWAGSNDPSIALRLYRERTGLNARLVVIGLAAGRPQPRGECLAVGGLDAGAMQVVSEFIGSA